MPIESHDATIYENKINELIGIYCADRPHIDITKSQSQFNAALRYVYKCLFKPDRNLMFNRSSNLDYTDALLLLEICDIYIDICNEHGREVSACGFENLTGITTQTLITWSNTKNKKQVKFNDVNDYNNDIITAYKNDNDNNINNNIYINNNDFNNDTYVINTNKFNVLYNNYNNHRNVIISVKQLNDIYSLIYKKLIFKGEESKRNKAFDNGNITGVLALLNHDHLYNMPGISQKDTVSSANMRLERHDLQRIETDAENVPAIEPPKI